MFHEHETIEDMVKNVGGAKPHICRCCKFNTKINFITGCHRWNRDDRIRTKIEELAIGDEENVHDSNIGVDQGEQTPPLEEGPQLRRTTRKHRPSTRYLNFEYILITDEEELKSF